MSAQQRLTLRPVTWQDAVAFVNSEHRHHFAPRGHKFTVGVEVGGGILCGVAIVGRPVARQLQDGRTLEVTRVATDGTPNACSALYGACTRAARAMGYRRLITYTLASEPGTSLKASGWSCEGQTRGGTWHRSARPRTDKAPTGPKQRWRIDL